MIRADPTLVWTNQYANPAGAQVHHDTTARAIYEAVAGVDVVVVGAGSTGTLMGCAQFFAHHQSSTRVVAVDSVGSVLFGGPGNVRKVPGLGVSRMPELFSNRFPFEHVMVPEREGILMCRRVAKSYGLLLGGSSGSILAGVQRLGKSLGPGSKVVALSPDMGDKYLGSLYSDEWFETHFPPVENDERSA